MRLLARDPLRYRRQILALKAYFIDRESTVIFLDDPQSKGSEHQFQTLAHGVVHLERLAPDYGRSRRRLQIVKMRGVDFDDGYHDLTIRTGGVVVYPRLDAASGGATAGPDRVVSGLSALDALLGGGPTRGTSLLLIGSAGAGKTTLCVQYVVTAATRGEHSAFFTFDERLETLMARSSGIGLDLRGYVASGHITARQVNPASLSPGEFVDEVRRSVERTNARIVVIDTLNGYLNAMSGNAFLTIQMHELLMYLGQRGVLTIVVVSQHGIIGTGLESPVDLSYLADTIVLVRYFEHAGRVRKSLAAIKTRSGNHEDSIREFRITADGIKVGEPLTDFNGVLTGLPSFRGQGPLLREQSTEIGPARGDGAAVQTGGGEDA